MNFNLVFALCFYINSLKLGYKNENSLKFQILVFIFVLAKGFTYFLIYFIVHMYKSLYQKSQSLEI